MVKYVRNMNTFFEKLCLSCGKTFVISTVVLSSLSAHGCFKDCEEHKYLYQEHTREEDRTPRGAQLYNEFVITDTSGSTKATPTSRPYIPNQNNYYPQA